MEWHTFLFIFDGILVAFVASLHGTLSFNPRNFGGAISAVGVILKLNQLWGSDAWAYSSGTNVLTSLCCRKISPHHIKSKMIGKHKIKIKIKKAKIRWMTSDEVMVRECEERAVDRKKFRVPLAKDE